MAHRTLAQRKQRSQFVIALAIVLLVFINRKQRRHHNFLSRSSLLPNPSEGTPWQALYAANDNRAYIVTMGVGVAVFQKILQSGFVAVAAVVGAFRELRIWWWQRERTLGQSAIAIRVLRIWTSPPPPLSRLLKFCRLRHILTPVFHQPQLLNRPINLLNSYGKASIVRCRIVDITWHSCNF